MAYFRILFATTAGIGCFCGSLIDKYEVNTLKVKAQVLDPENTPGSEYYNDPHLESRFAVYGLPQRDVTLRYQNFQMNYDQKHRIPNWVVEHLNCSKLNGEEGCDNSRRNNATSYSFDARIQREFQSDESDYETKMRPYTLAEKHNYVKSAHGAGETLRRTNTVPQHVEFSVGIWADLNSYCRYLTKVFDDVYVFTGPVFESNKAQTRMRYRVSQTNQLAFPTHYFKIIICKTGDKFKLCCFVLPNECLVGLDYSLKQFQVTLARIEQRVGFKLFKDGCNVNLTEDSLPYISTFRQRKDQLMPDESLIEAGIPEEPQVPVANIGGCAKDAQDCQNESDEDLPEN